MRCSLSCVPLYSNVAFNDKPVTNNTCTSEIGIS